MGILGKGVIEHLAKNLSNKIPGDNEIQYGMTKYLDVSNTMVFESLSFASAEYDHGIVITERKDGSVEIRVPLRYTGEFKFTGIESTRYLCKTATGEYVLSREPEDPKLIHVYSEAIGYNTLVRMLIHYFGQLDFLKRLTTPPRNLP